MASCKKGSADRMMVLRGCTGTYLRIDASDYQVCNEEKLRGFPNGDRRIQAYGDLCSGSRPYMLLYAASQAGRNG